MYFSNIENLNPFYTIHDRFHREDERLKTFDTWPLDFISVRELAVTGKGDIVKCYFCEVEIFSWKPMDIPVEEHQRWRSSPADVPPFELWEIQIFSPRSALCGRSGRIGTTKPELHANAHSHCLPPSPPPSVKIRWNGDTAVLLLASFPQHCLGSAVLVAKVLPRKAQVEEPREAGYGA
ncbi:uncharacterized protein LOC142235426 [Haematobia irritans]|uniref:uncharacterized protein LOC142235426 n=1 Tax=Haematobia irritans TaxID=7368 RepID=UPI003F4FAD26